MRGLCYVSAGAKTRRGKGVDPVYEDAGAVIESPVGEILVTCRGGAVTGIHFMQPGARPRAGSSGEGRVLGEAIGQLEEYFAGRRRSFSLPLALDGTAFQLAAWEELSRIPWGRTISYGEQARRMGRPGAARAVGGANRRNPVAIVIPCHRVIGADGSLTGFGGGLGRKEALLSLEGALP